jgi:hypothetical protein
VARVATTLNRSTTGLEDGYQVASLGMRYYCKRRPVYPACGPKGLATPRRETPPSLEGAKLGADRERGDNKTRSASVTGSRPTFVMGTVGERGLAHGAWRAITTSGVSELSPAPWRLCPTWNRPGVRLELSPGTPTWRWSYLRPPMWGGQRRAPTGRMPGEA